MAASGLFFLNGYDLYDVYGIVIEDGKSGFLAMPARKESLSYSWAEEDGTEHDLSEPRFEDLNVTLKCALLAANRAEYFQKRKLFFQELIQSGLQTLTITDYEQDFQVFYKSTSNNTLKTKRFKGIDLPAFTFDITLYVANSLGTLLERPLNMSFTQINIDVLGGSTGSITVSGSGGSGSYQYLIDGFDYQGNEVYVNWTAPKSGSHTFANLKAGSYTVEVRDADQTDNVKTATVTLTQPVMVLATATLSVSGTSVQQGNQIQLSYGVSMGNETTVSSRALQRRAAGSSNAWEDINQPGTNDGIYNHAPTESSEYRYRIVTESGEKVSPVRTVTVTAPPVTSFFGWKSTGTPLTEAQINAIPGDSDPTTHIVTHVSGADVTADYRANTSPMYLYYVELASEPIKTKWYGTDSNKGDIGGEEDLFGAHVIVGPYRFTITQYATQNTETTIQFRK